MQNEVHQVRRHEHTSALYWRLLQMVLGSFAICAIIVGLSLLIVHHLTQPAFLDRGQLLLIVPLGLFWIWGLRKHPITMVRCLKDLSSQDLKEIEGILHLHTRRGIGLIAPHRLFASIGGQRFGSDLHEENEHFSGKHVRAYFTPCSKTLVGIFPATDCNEVGRTSIDEGNHLNDAEIARLALIAKGLSDKEIARSIGLSPSTIRTYNSALFRKLGVAGRKEAAEIAVNRGIADVD